MKKIVIRGGKPLYGDINVSGMKNAALPIIFASILTKDKCVIENLPEVSDVALSLRILRSMGASVRMINRTTVEIDTTHLVGGSSPYQLVSKLRGSTYLLGAELGRFGEAKVGFSGGCDFGTRPIDQHKKGFEALGAVMTIENGCNHIVTGPGGLCGASIYFDIASVGATINVILAAVMTPGRTSIDNAAREPHIVDLANFLNMCGARISGAGTSFIKIQGVEKLHGCNYTIIPDMIEAGTYMTAAAAAGGRVTVRGVIPKHMETVTAKLLEMGVSVDECDDSIVVSRSTPLQHANIKTYFYPGFPTDMHPQFVPLLAVAEGPSSVTENIWSGRFDYLAELRKMGVSCLHADSSNTAMINPGQHLTAASVTATDLRGGAAMVIAALMADGVSRVSKAYIIERGYDNLIGKLRALGAGISCDMDEADGDDTPPPPCTKVRSAAHVMPR